MFPNASLLMFNCFEFFESKHLECVQLSLLCFWGSIGVAFFFIKTKLQEIFQGIMHSIPSTFKSLINSHYLMPSECNMRTAFLRRTLLLLSLNNLFISHAEIRKLNWWSSLMVSKCYSMLQIKIFPAYSSNYFQSVLFRFKICADT